MSFPLVRPPTGGERLAPLKGDLMNLNTSVDTPKLKDGKGKEVYQYEGKISLLVEENEGLRK